MWQPDSFRSYTLVLSTPPGLSDAIEAFVESSLATLGLALPSVRDARGTGFIDEAIFFETDFFFFFEVAALRLDPSVDPFALLSFSVCKTALLAEIGASAATAVDASGTASEDFLD